MSLYAEYLKRYPTLMSCLENAKRSGRFAHSFLIHSPDPQVRKEFTIVLQQLAGCTSGSDGRPDVNCTFCRQLEKGIYPDSHSIAPVGKMFQIRVGDAGNPEPNTLRDMLDHLGYTAGDHRKFGVIEDADRMGPEAQNALLKTLEEPPSETTIILAAANPSSLLPTTRSRCQFISLPDNRCRFDFDGLDILCRELAELCFRCGNDITRIESSAAKIIAVAAGLAARAEAETDLAFADRIASAKQSEDPAFMKRMETRRSDAASGAYMRQRRCFLTAVETFCSQLFLLSSGCAFEELPNPELFSGIEIPGEISPSRGSKIQKEAEELLFTLRFSVPDELALRTFAMNIALG